MNNGFRLYFPDIVGSSAHALLPGQWNGYRRHEQFIAPDLATTVNKTSADPTGYCWPRCYHPPIKQGDMSWRSEGEGDFTLSMFASRNMDFDFTGSGDLDISIAAAAAMAFAMTGSGTLTCSLAGRASTSFDFTGSGDLDVALKALGNMVMELTGTGDLDVALKAYGNMSFDIVVTGTGLTTANIGQAVWDYLLSTGYSASEAMDVLTAVAAGKVSGGPGSPVFRSIDDTRNVVNGTADASGNRSDSAITPEG